MTVKSTLSNLGTYALGLAILLAVCAIPVVFLLGAEWVGEKILPWLGLLCLLTFALNLVVLGPLALIKPTRGWAGLGFYISSLVFGLSVWFLGFLTTLDLWGVGAVVIGLFILGIGCVPIAMLATLLNGMWIDLVILVFLVVLTYGLRILGLSLAEAADRAYTSGGSPT